MMKILTENSLDESFLRINKLADQGKISQALSLCKKLFLDFPEHPRVLHAMGLLSYRSGDRDAAENFLQKAIALKPDYVDAYFNLGNCYRHAFKLDEAANYLKSALDLDPYHYKALSSYALLLLKQKKYHDALVCCDTAIAVNSRKPEAYIAKGSILAETGNIVDSVAFMQKALRLRPNNDGQSGLIFLLNSLPGVSQADIYTESILWARRFAEPLTMKARPPLNSVREDRILRVGYVSGDFKLHPVSHHLKPVILCHDKKSFEIFLYSNFAYGDEMTNELAYHSHQFRDISPLDDERATELIRSDGIDILIDLAGHTAYHRLGIFARRAAPVQVSWLGYFNTTGLSAMDYLLSDPLTIPEGEEHWFSEKILRMPECRFCYAPPSYAPAVASPPALKNHFVTFGSFNKLAKVNEKVLTAWARVLRSVPCSRLLIKWSSVGDADVKTALVARFAELGVPQERLILRNDTPHPEMLAEYGDVDIALDTFPYNGGATTCEALWMGVPVVTLDGNTPIGRQSKSFLHAIGHAEWVAHDEDAYVEIAIGLAGDISKLNNIRSELRHQMSSSPLCDGKSFTRYLETTYRRIWKDWCLSIVAHDERHLAFRRFSVEELFDSGVNSMDGGDYVWALCLFNAVLKRNPRHFRAHNNSGICYLNLGQPDSALSAFKKAVRNNKDDGKAFNNLGRMLLEAGQSKKAVSICERAVELEPDNPDFLINLGIAYRETGHLRRARELFEKILDSDPSNEIARTNLANLFLKAGTVQDAVEQLHHISENSFEALSALLFYSQNIAETDNAWLLQNALRFNKLMEMEGMPTFAGRSGGTCTAQDCLNVGFVSSDFKEHPVGMLMMALFKYYNPERLRLFCYNNGRRCDGLTEWYRKNSTGWHDIAGLPDDQAADLIRTDQIDILVDLAGHTYGHRLSLFAHRVAPVQVSWIGYCHTTGIRAMDYIIADDEYIRPCDEKFFTEKVVRLPYNRFCFTPPNPSPLIASPPMEENGFVTFGCFNNLGKINSSVLDVWAQLLGKVPRSRLILKSKSFVDIEIRRSFKQQFTSRGINPRRLELRSSSPRYFMLMEYNDIDIALDPFPFSGGMTSLEALWMGVPIITMPGELPISRQTSSFLRLLGLDDFIALNTNNYVELAVKFSHDLGRLRAIRENSRKLMSVSPLCNAEKYAQSVEELFFSIRDNSFSEYN
jgi:predicted O-linked N-acetylglucosamine transferase (SPINDLY family)